MREFAFINNCFVGNLVKLFRSAAVNIMLTCNFTTENMWRRSKYCKGKAAAGQL